MIGNVDKDYGARTDRAGVPQSDSTQHQGRGSEGDSVADDGRRATVMSRPDADTLPKHHVSPQSSVRVHDQTRPVEDAEARTNSRSPR